MELANIKIALNGDNLNVVYKHNVTPIEVVVLKTLHGDDCIKEVQILPGEDKRTRQAEYFRLEEIYGRAKDMDGKAIFHLMFPNKYNLNFPKTFKRIGYGPDQVREVPTDLDPVKKAGYYEAKMKKGFNFKGLRDMEAEIEEDVEDDEDEEEVDDKESNDFDEDDKPAKPKRKAVAK